MANITNPDDKRLATADPEQTRVVFAGDLADDDLTWIVRLSLPELHRMVLSPTAWVASLAGLEGWDVLPPTLRRDFTMLVERTDATDPQGWVALQGISGTNALTLVASRAAGIRSLLYFAPVQGAVAKLYGRDVEGARALGDAELLECPGDPFAPFWEESARSRATGETKPLPVVAVPSIGRFSAHFEILEPGDEPLERAARTASFFLAAAGDPKGFERMLRSLPQERSTAGALAREGGERPVEIVVPEPASSSQPSGVSYAGTDDLDDDGSTVCTMIVGPYEEDPENPEDGEGTVTGTLVKRYGVGDDPTHPEPPVDEPAENP